MILGLTLSTKQLISTVLASLLLFSIRNDCEHIDSFHCARSGYLLGVETQEGKEEFRKELNSLWLIPLTTHPGWTNL